MRYRRLANASQFLFHYYTQLEHCVNLFGWDATLSGKYGQPVEKQPSTILHAKPIKNTYYITWIEIVRFRHSIQINIWSKRPWHRTYVTCRATINIFEKPSKYFAHSKWKFCLLNQKTHLKCVAPNLSSIKLLLTKKILF